MKNIKGPVREALQKQIGAATQHNFADKLAEAGLWQDARNNRETANFHEEEAAALLRVDDQDVVKQPGGEALLENHPDKQIREEHLHLVNTLHSPGLIAINASQKRLHLADEAQCLEMALDVEETIGAGNSLERMLAQQMAAHHTAIMKCIAKGLLALDHEPLNPYSQTPTAEICKIFNTAAKLSASYQGLAQTLIKLRTGGRQEVFVQHVNVEGGGQAVVAGKVDQGGAGEKGGGHGKK